MPVKNRLMFSIDDMRAVNGSGNFAPLVATPDMACLAAQGTTFEHAMTQVRCAAPRAPAS